MFYIQLVTLRFPLWQSVCRPPDVTYFLLGITNSFQILSVFSKVYFVDIYFSKCTRLTHLLSLWRWRNIWKKSIGEATLPNNDFLTATGININWVCTLSPKILEGLKKWNKIGWEYFPEKYLKFSCYFLVD